MKNYLLVPLLLTVTAHAATTFNIEIPANATFGSSAQAVVVQCDQVVPEQTIQMNCTLPQQTSTQNAQLLFVRNGITAGSFRLNSIGTFQTNGALGNTFVTVELFNNDLPSSSPNTVLANNNQTPPFVYTPQLRLINPTPTNLTMTCNNIIIPATSNICRLVY